jgi:integrase
MSVFKPKRSPYFAYDFEIQGHRFYGSTKCKTRREAEVVERDLREQKKQEVADQQGAASSLQLDHVADRYWIERGQHHAGADNTERDLARLIEYFGKTILLTEITDDDVTKLVAWRRGHRVIRSKATKAKDAPLISNATVNRSTTEMLKKLFTHARRWGVTFRREPNWRDHMLPEPVERIRELREDEGERIDDAMREDYAPLFAFVHTTGVRQKEATLLQWSEVNWQTRQIVKKGKGGKTITVKITATVRDILWPLRGHHPEAVFTYVAQRTRDGLIKGERYPLTLSGVKTRWRRTRKAAGVTDFRFHDFRHNFATKLMRQERNPKLVQRALNHADFKTTMRYMHVLDDEVGDAVERLAQSRKNPGLQDAESVTQSPGKGPGISSVGLPKPLTKRG